MWWSYQKIVLSSVIFFRVGFLGACFEVVVGGKGKIRPPPLPCLELVRIMLQILVYKYTHICSFRNYTVWYQDPNIAVSASFCKKSGSTQSNSMSAVLEIF